MRYIDADELKRRIRDSFHGSGKWLEDCEKIDGIIDRTKELKPFDRDIGKEPVLEQSTQVWHESYMDGTGAFKQSEILEWRCPNCGWFVGELYSGFGRWHVQSETSYCAECGQKIDWTLPKAEEKRRYEERKAKEREEWLKKNNHPLDNMNESRRRKHGLLSEGGEADE